MDELNKFILKVKYELNPQEVEILRNFLNDYITFSSTNSNYVKKENITCPLCQSKNFKKNGKKNNVQRYFCYNCSKSFSSTTNTILYFRKLTYKQFLTLIECMRDSDTIEVTANKIGVSNTTAYYSRIKIINILNKYNEKVILSGIVQADEMYIPLNFKGTKTKNMPRKSHKRGNQDRLIGISKEDVCIVTAIDSDDNMILKVSETGSASTEMIENVLGGKIEAQSILVTDSKNSYKKFAINNKLELKQIPAGEYTVDTFYNLSELNALHSNLELWLSKFKGVSIRHMQTYLDWFRYLKILKYTCEYASIVNSIFIFTVNQESKLKRKDIHNKELPINIDDIFRL